MSKIKLQSRVADFIERHSLISPEEIVVVGVSGGADSVCLLHLLATWRKGVGVTLHVAHLNHQLRGVESEADAEYVSNLAGSLGIPITIDRQDVAAYRVDRNCSIEEAARELRYAFLARVAGEVGANRVAVGHTRDDQVETILMHILRGAGITGLCGLAPCSPMVFDEQRSDLLVIRPMLDVTREETASYCQTYQLAPRIDSSNLSLSFFRNRLRLQLLPLLRQYNPGIDQALLRLSDIAREDNAFIEQRALELWGDVARQENSAIYLNRKQIASLPVALQRHLLRMAVTLLAGDVRDIEASHIDAARSLLCKPASKRISLPHGYICQAGYDEIVITGTAQQSQLPPCPFPPLPGQFTLEVPGKTVLPGWKVIANVAGERVDEGYCEHPKGVWQSLEIASSPSAPRNDRVQFHPAQLNLCETISADFDFHKAGKELFVRQSRPGDSFRPLGMNMPKKLSEFMVDAKIPRSWRSHIPLVCSPQQIVWVVGCRIDDRVGITETSKEILRLEFIRTE
jgi:tRNA(Ile)-lysidine synthase